ncbi:hypothetical protein GHYDROH2_17070 [Geobacter hydrogenophilus]|uniref:Uncharacterized protein n=1 Tax=Geobacter hydrogenophilus TaxID=40983 RepID=A0A9W6LD78_9BACT|nr:hypothetical protein GHYDROH2_17070 [Geobacter hydrogenophilus]
MVLALVGLHLRRADGARAVIEDTEGEFRGGWHRQTSQLDLSETYTTEPANGNQSQG